MNWYYIFFQSLVNGNLNVKYVQRLKNVLYVLLQYFVVSNISYYLFIYFFFFLFDLHKILSDMNAMNRSKKK